MEGIMSDQPISVGGTMFDDLTLPIGSWSKQQEFDREMDILSQPPTPQALVDVLGWSWDAENRNLSDFSLTRRRLQYCDYSDEWFFVVGEYEFIDVPDIPTLRDVVILCERLGIPCEVKR